MERAQDKVSSKRRLDCHARRLDVSNLTDHYSVWVLSQEGAKRRRECHSHALLNGHLQDSVDVIFDRIFGS